MRAVVLRSAAVIAVGAVVLAAVLYVASTVDARPPEVIGISITQSAADDSYRALVNTSIEVEFNEPVDQESAADALRIEPAIEGTTSWSGSTLIFTPAEPLALETTYAVGIEPSVVVDLRGNRMDEAPDAFSFTTVGRPLLVDADPADGATDVAVDAVITLVFSTLMDTTSVEAALQIDPDLPRELRWSGERLEIVPGEPLDPGTGYVVTVGEGAADVAGVTLGEPSSVTFRTVAPGLVAESLVPADGIDGVAVSTPIAVVFDRLIDPSSLDPSLLVVTPEVAGTLEVVGLPGEPDDDSGSGRVLQFTPSGPLPPNTTFQLELSPGLRSPGGGEMAAPLAWSFTTGAPPTTISNQVTFVSDRSGIANVWAMNPDGTGQRQLSAELAPIVDYAVAPDGSSLVVADGRRLVFLRADGSERRVLTDEGTWEFDPAYAPDGLRLAFARADAATGEGLGLWTWDVGGGAATELAIPRDLRDDEPSPDPDAGPGLLRAPRYAPDGLALVFVDASGAIGVLELPGQRHTRVPFSAGAPPSWLPTSGALLVTGRPDGDPVDRPTVEAPVLPLSPSAADEVFRLGRSAVAVDETVFAPGWRLLAIGPDGELAFADAAGGLGITDSLSTLPADRIVSTERVLGAAFGPGDGTLAIVVDDGQSALGRIERLDLDTGLREALAPSGTRLRWLP